VSLDGIDRTAAYFDRSKDERAKDPLEFARRVRVGLQVQAYQRLSKEARELARRRTQAANVIDWGKARRRFRV
jgi:hypothetical protein